MSGRSGSQLLYVGPMIVTGALLAESASVVDNKLEVTGGVVSAYRRGEGPTVPVTLVVLTRSQAFDKAPKVILTVEGPSGDSTIVELDVPDSCLGGEIGFFCAPMRIPVPVDGRYVFSIPGQGGAIELPLNVVG